MLLILLSNIIIKDPDEDLDEKIVYYLKKLLSPHRDRTVSWALIFKSVCVKKMKGAYSRKPGLLMYLDLGLNQISVTYICTFT